jgi:hypothetical protein
MGACARDGTAFSELSRVRLRHVADRYPTRVANMIRWTQEGHRPDRDLILVLETDEEIADVNAYGITWLLKNHRDLIDAELALDEGGGVGLKDGKPLWNNIQTSEKLYQSVWLEVRNQGGHSSQPRKDNAISTSSRQASLGSRSSRSRWSSTTRRASTSKSCRRSRAARSPQT